MHPINTCFNLVIYSTPMNAYHFVPGSASLNQQSNGDWIASFEATIYQNQQISETSNTINTAGDRVIEFEVTGAEESPLHDQEGASAPYARGGESLVELVLTKDGKRKNVIATTYP